MNGEDMRDVAKTFELVVAVLISAGATAKALADLIDFVTDRKNEED